MIELVGLIPAAGRAERIAPLPCSKELYPIGFYSPEGNDRVRPQAVCQYLLGAMRFAGITKVYIVLRRGKWDIPSYLSVTSPPATLFSYLVLETSPGVPYTLDHAYPFVKNALVAFGFPDLVFSAKDAFAKLLVRQSDSKADVVLGLFPADRPEQLDMVAVNDSRVVKDIRIKPKRTNLRYTWGVALWTPVFTEFLHRHLASIATRRVAASEISVGHILGAAVKDKLRIEGIIISKKSYIDIGTPDGLMKAFRQFEAR
jgi:glucose-1-phosphate thymidylyltransferase